MVDKIYKILIIDDEVNVLDALRKTLERSKQFKSDISIADSSQKALGILKNQNFDLVICDYKMPKMNGVELLTKVKELNPDTIRILITGYSDLQIAREAINKASVHNYIEKPWDNENLRETIYSAIKETETKDSDVTLENFFSSDNSSTLLNALINMEATENYSHTIIKKDEDRLPKIEKLNSILNLLSRYEYLKIVHKSPVVFKCPICSSYDYRLIVKCPLCASDFIEKGDVVEHYNCGHVDMLSKFEKLEKLTCPKCGEDLRQIGEDYRKVGNWIHCRNCGEFFGEGNFSLFCNECGSSSNINHTIWEYEKRIIPNKEYLSNIKTKIEISKEIKNIVEKNGFFYTQNLHVKKENKYDISVFQKDPRLEKEIIEPLIMADIEIDQSGFFSDKLKEFNEKSKNMENKNLYFVAYPFLSNESVILAEKLNIQAIEFQKFKSVLDKMIESRNIVSDSPNKSKLRVLKLNKKYYTSHMRPPND